MTLKNCRDCNAILNDRRSYPKGWDKGLCESCNEYFETNGKGYKDGGSYLNDN